MFKSSRINAWKIIMMLIGGATLASFLTEKLVLTQLAWLPGLVEAGEIWRLLTYALVLMEPLSLFFELLFIWFVVPTVEYDWGKHRVLAFFALSSLAASLVAILLSHLGVSILFLFGPGAALLGFMYAFSRRNPNQTFLLFFIVPVKAKWFVAVYVGMRLVFSINQPHLLSMLMAELAGALIALGLFSGHTWLRTRRTNRRLSRLTVVRQRAKKPSGNGKLIELIKKPVLGPTDLKLLKKEEARTFTFEVCPPADFFEKDPYCQSCQAFGYCLARKRLPR